MTESECPNCGHGRVGGGQGADILNRTGINEGVKIVRQGDSQ